MTSKRIYLIVVGTLAAIILTLSAVGKSHGRTGRRAANDFGRGPRMSANGLYIVILQGAKTLAPRKMYTLQAIRRRRGHTANPGRHHHNRRRHAGARPEPADAPARDDKNILSVTDTAKGIAVRAGCSRSARSSSQHGSSRSRQKRRAWSVKIVAVCCCSRSASAWRCGKWGRCGTAPDASAPTLS